MLSRNCGPGPVRASQTGGAGTTRTLPRRSGRRSGSPWPGRGLGREETQLRNLPIRSAARIVVLAAAMTGCGIEDPTGPTALSGVMATAPAATVAQRVVSLSPTATEILFAIGADKQVVAVDDQSNHPAGVPVTDLSGYTPNV